MTVDNMAAKAGIRMEDSWWISKVKEVATSREVVDPRRDVAQRRNLASQPRYVPPTFNDEMQTTWDNILAEGPDLSGGRGVNKIGIDALVKYKKILQVGAKDGKALLKVNLAYARSYVKEKMEE